MQLLVTNNANTIQTLKPIFSYSYEEFLKDLVGPKFDSIVPTLYSATIIYDDYDSQVVKAFSLHRAITCENPDDPVQYLSDSPEHIKKRIQQIGPVLSFEWVTVAKEFRGGFSKVRAMDLILSVSMEVVKNYGFGAGMGFSRQDMKIDKAVAKHGFSMNGTVDRFGIPCTVMFCEGSQKKDHPVQEVNSISKELWTNRIVDHTEINSERKKAA